MTQRLQRGGRQKTAEWEACKAGALQASHSAAVLGQRLLQRDLRAPGAPGFACSWGSWGLLGAPGASWGLLGAAGGSGAYSVGMVGGPGLARRKQ